MAIKLPLLNAQDPVMNRYQTLLQGALMPITNSPSAAAQQVFIKDAVSGNLTPNIPLLAGTTTVIPIGLSSSLQGWFLIRNKVQAIVWDNQDSNTTPSQTLLLNTSADTTIQLMVF
jgi:hypothetical protein